MVPLDFTLVSDNYSNVLLILQVIYTHFGSVGVNTMVSIVLSRRYKRYNGHYYEMKIAGK